MLHRQQFGVFEQKHKEMQRDVFMKQKIQHIDRYLNQLFEMIIRM